MTGEGPDGLSASKNRILYAATALFLEKGYDDVTLDEIVKDARVSKTSIYKTFGSKEQLLYAVVENSGLESISEAFSDPGDGEIRANLHHVGKRYLKRLFDPGTIAIMRFCMALAPRFPRVGAFFLTALRKRSNERAAALIERWSNQGLIKVDNPEAAAANFLLLLQAKRQMEALCDPKFSMSDDELDSDVSSAVDTMIISMDGKPVI